MAVMEPTKSSISQEMPLYRSINEELSCKYKGQQKPYEELLVTNIPLRDSCLDVLITDLVSLNIFIFFIRCFIIFHTFDK